MPFKQDLSPRHKPHRIIPLKLNPIPFCPFCGQPLRILTHSKPHRVEDFTEILEIITYYYGCRRPMCKKSHGSLRCASNPYCSPRSSLSYGVQTQICQWRWKYNKTYSEIRSSLAEQYEINRSLRGIELILKEYEQSCADHLTPKDVEHIRQNRRIILSIDGMKPLNGEDGIYGIYDVLSGIPLACGRLVQQSEFCISEFLDAVKHRLHSSGLDVPIVATISDALVAQRLGLEKNLRDAMICLCHYHFYELILKEARQADSAIVTKLRSQLRKFYYVLKYKRIRSQHLELPWTPAITHLLDVLICLSNRKSRDKNQCFTSPEYMDQIQDLLKLCQTALDSTHTLPVADQKVLRSLITKIRPIHTSFLRTTNGIRKIHTYVKELKVVLNADEPADQGESRLHALSTRWKEDLNKHRKRLIPEEIQFLDNTIKYLRTKTPYLMNYRRVEGAPKTNNRQEQRYHQIKYKLRRIIGHVAAKDFLFKHGKSILFVNPDATDAEIKDILMNAPIAKIRKQIREGRKHRNSLEECIYDQAKWDAEMAKLKAEFTPYLDLKKRLT